MHWLLHLSLFCTTFSFRCLNVNLEEIDVSANVKDSNVTSDTCKIEPKIPFFLIVAGILNIALLILRAIFQVGFKYNKTLLFLIKRKLKGRWKIIMDQYFDRYASSDAVENVAMGTMVTTPLVQHVDFSPTVLVSVSLIQLLLLSS